MVRILGVNITTSPVFVVTELCWTSLDIILQLDQQDDNRPWGEPPEASTSCSRPHPPVPLLTLTCVLQLSHDIAMGLAALHRAGSIHRRLEPGKVLLDSAGRGKLGDHALARRTLHASGSVLKAGAGQGWFAYMGPEAFTQALDPGVPQIDSYSLALLMWTMLEGRRPWEGMDDMAVLYQVV